MIQLELSHDEQHMLVSILENYLSELRMEISHTDRKDFRDSLKQRKELVQKVVATLQEHAS